MLGEYPKNRVTRLLLQPPLAAWGAVVWVWGSDLALPSSWCRRGVPSPALLLTLSAGGTSSAGRWQAPVVGVCHSDAFDSPGGRC